MIPDLSAVFSRYESLRAEADTLFSRVNETQPGCVTCKERCSDCCHALFDLSLVEAMYLNRAFSRAFAHGSERSAILSRAAETDRRLTRLKRDLFRAEKDGENPEAIMAHAARIKLRALCSTRISAVCSMKADLSPVACTGCLQPSAVRGMSAVFRPLKRQALSHCASGQNAGPTGGFEP